MGQSAYNLWRPMYNFLWGLQTVVYWAGQKSQIASPHVTNGTFMLQNDTHVDNCIYKSKRKLVKD